MMKYEFENLAGRKVTDEQYRAIETLYMSSNLEKAEFVKSIKTMLKSIPQPEKKKDIKRMAVRDRSGYRKTPNGCYYHIKYSVYFRGYGENCNPSPAGIIRAVHERGHCRTVELFEI